jgi:peptide deformylase
MVREILQHPDPRLRIVAAELDMSTQEGIDLAQGVAMDLLDTFVKTPRAIGLAATQIGLPHRVIVVDLKRQGIDLYVMINPVIVKQTPQMQRVKDGCMSVQHGNWFASTKRPLGITVEWIDSKDGSTRRQKFRNLIAAVVHHEIDHLNGRLFIDGVHRWRS